MTDIEKHKALVREFCALYTQGDWAAVGELLHEDFRWTAIVSQQRQSPLLAGIPPLGAAGYSKAETLAVFASTKSNCVDGRFDLTPVAMTAEGDRVAFEAEGYAVNKANGRTYDNRYHHLMTFADGKITALREYQDTALLIDVWMAP